MARKNVYAAIEIADREVRLVVLELFDGRTNILRTERVAHDGVLKRQIRDEKKVQEAVETAVAQAQKALGYHIERVFLAIPADEVKNISRKVHVDIEDGTHTVRLFHLQQGLNSAIRMPAPQNMELMNINRIACLENGTVLDKLPLGRDTQSFDMEVDLLYGIKDQLYSYAAVIEKAGLQILDICQSAYAQAKETAALVQSEEEDIVQVTLEADHTALAYLRQGKLMQVMELDQGYNSFISQLQEENNLTDATAWRLLENLFQPRVEDIDDSIIFIEQQEDRRVEITSVQLAKSVLPNIRSWIAEINAACRPMQMGNSIRYILTGQGADIPVLRQMGSAFSADANVYTVSDIGARQNAYAACLGMAYAWEDANRIRHQDKNSVNNNELEASIDSISRYGKESEGGFTKKLRKVMLQG